jgi:hypothetical protein
MMETGRGMRWRPYVSAPRHNREWEPDYQRHAVEVIKRRVGCMPDLAFASKHLPPTAST